MKKLCLILLMLCSMHTWAQVSDAYKTQIESIFQNVNRSYVTTGLLSDYGLYFTNIDKFNGILSDTNYIEFGPHHIYLRSAALSGVPSPKGEGGKIVVFSASYNWGEGSPHLQFLQIII